MKMLKLGFAFMSIVILAGCASVQETTPQYQTGEFPELGVTTTVYVGQVMVSEYDYMSQDRATLRGSVSGSL